MIFLLFTLPFITFIAYVTSDKLLYLNINKLTSYDPLTSSNNTSNKLQFKNFSKLFTVQDKKWNKRLRLFFIFIIALYFNFISIIIYEIFQYEHIDDNVVMDDAEKLQQVFITTFCIPLMFNLLSVLLSFVIPFTIIFLGLQKFHLVKTFKQLLITSILMTFLCYQIIVNNIVNLNNQKASILLKIGVIGMIIMSSLSAIGCVITTYYHYFLKNNNKISSVSERSHQTSENIFTILKKIINDPKNHLLYSLFMDTIFLYYCNFKNIVTLFFKIPKSVANLDIVYGLNKITTDELKNANPMVTSIINIINFFYYTEDEKIDQVFMIKLISILLSFSLFILCFSYILSFLRNGLNILIYYFDLTLDGNKKEGEFSNDNQNLPRYKQTSAINNPSHIKNFIFAEFVGIYIVATTLVILKLFLPAEIEEFISKKVFNNWMSINVETQSKLINTSADASANIMMRLYNWLLSIPQFPLINKLVLIKANNLSVFDNIQFIFDISFQFTWCFLVLGILGFEIYSSKILGNDDHLLISFIADKYSTISRSNSASDLYLSVKRKMSI
ncbi:unnamed protein product [Hanseniaspora opuntiae]